MKMIQFYFNYKMIAFCVSAVCAIVFAVCMKIRENRKEKRKTDGIHVEGDVK